MWRCIQGLVLLSCLAVCRGRYTIRPLGFVKLPFTMSPTETFKIDSGSAEEGAYDPKYQHVYVVGDGSNLLNVVDVSDPMNPKRVFTHEFDPADGIPRDVEVCGDQFVVSLSSEVPVFPGHVQFFKTLQRGATSLEFVEKVTVGEFPDNLKYSTDCKTVVVANEGRSGLDYAKRFVDPEGSLTIIYNAHTGNPTERSVDFNSYNHRHDIRGVAKSVPQTLLNQHSTVARELEPEYVSIIDTSAAYVAFQENDLLMKISLSTGDISDSFVMQPKQYRSEGLDGSDRDGGIHIRKYPLLGNRNPDSMHGFFLNRRPYLVTADEGYRTRYTLETHGFNWSEGERARVVEYQKGLDIATINNASFVADMNDDSKLGRLYLSKIDGLNPFTSNIEDIYTYGGRGFSIWDPSSRTIVFDSGDELERRARDSYYNVFNTDFTQAPVYSPEGLKDTVSDDMGPKPNGLDVLEDNGEIFLVVGSETTGILYLYNISYIQRSVQVGFQDIYRRGKTDSLYSYLYEQPGDDIGDMKISDIGLIPSANSPTNRTMFYVLGAGSGSLSLYEIDNLGPDIPLNP